MHTPRIARRQQAGIIPIFVDFFPGIRCEAWTDEDDELSEGGDEEHGCEDYGEDEEAGEAGAGSGGAGEEGGDLSAVFVEAEEDQSWIDD